MIGVGVGLPFWTKRVYAGSTTYDFTNWSTDIENAWEGARQGGGDNPPEDTPSDMVSSQAFTSGMLDNLKTDDGAYAEVSMGSDTEESYFTFKVSEDVSTISEFTVEWNGYFDKTYGHLWVWNDTDSSWEQLDDLSTSDATASGTVTTNISDYFKQDNIWIAVTSAPTASCPILYTWDGESHEYIYPTSYDGGLGFPGKVDNEFGLNQILEPSQPRGSMVIKNSQLNPENGNLKVIMAEDMDEITYLDYADLRTVYHPSGTELFTSIPIYITDWTPQEPYIHSIRDPIEPIEAYYENGESIIDEISERDDVWTPETKAGEYSRMVLNYGELENPDTVKLFLQEDITWDYSPPLRPSYIEVWNGENWQRIQERPDSLPELGEDAGAGTAAVIDISNWFPDDVENYKLRFNDWHSKSYNFVFLDTSKDEFVMIQNDLMSAEMFWKGKSTYIDDGWNYSSADKDYIPANYEGNFTRYGNVDNLIKEVDDKFVINHPGDAVEMSFKPIDTFNFLVDLGLIEKSYVFVSDAYFKPLPMKDYVYGENDLQVRPLPFHGMEYYPYPENESFPWDNEHEDWWNTYQTRKIGGHSSGTLYNDYVKVDIISNSPPTVENLENTNITYNSADLNVDVSDPDGDDIDWCAFIDNSDDSVIENITGHYLNYGTTWTGLSANTPYSWYVMASDNNGAVTTSSTQTFTTNYHSPYWNGSVYEIDNVQELQWMRNDLDNSYVLVDNIDASSTANWNDNGDGGYYGFDPIGDSDTEFDGVFDGDNFIIENLYINRPSSQYVGLFGYVGSYGVDAGVVENVSVIDENIIGDEDVGGLIGEIDKGYVTNCHTTGSVRAKTWRAGGLIGFVLSTASYVEKCHSDVDVYSDGANGIAGGLVGYADDGHYNRCYATGSVEGSNAVGGFIGRYDSLRVSANNYATGDVTGSGDVGGFIGRAIYQWKIEKSYSVGSVSGTGDVGGFIGDNQETKDTCYVDDSFWDTETSGQSSSAFGGTGKTTDNMKSVRTFTDESWSVGLDNAWDFTDDPYDDTDDNNFWAINPDNNEGYPFLSWQEEMNPPPNTPSNPSPSDGSTISETTSTGLNVDVSDPEGDTLDVGFVNESWADNLVGWWPMETQNNLTVFDWSGNNNDGAMNNMTTDNYVSGQEGIALDFDGTDDYVDLEDVLKDSSNNTYTQGTISLWYYPDSFYNYNTIWDDSANQNNWEMWIYTSGVLKARIEVDGEVYYDLTNLQGTNAWYHIVFTWNKTNGSYDSELYVNGVLRDSQSGGTWVESGSNFYIASGNSGNTQGDGKADEVRIYDQVLSESEIEQLYNSTHIDNDVASGGTASMTWGGLSGGNDYSWYAVATDDEGASTQSSTWSFTVNTAPDSPTNPSPSDGAILSSGTSSTTISADVNDSDGDSMDITFYDGGDTQIGTDTITGSGTASTAYDGLSDGNDYSWYVVVDDGMDSTTSSTWSFHVNSPPTASFTENSPKLTDENVNFDASASDDPDGSIDLYEWDWTNDGTYDAVSPPGSNPGIITPDHSYSDDGTYTVKLRVTDDDGATDTTTRDVTINNRSPNTPTNLSPSGDILTTSPTLSADVSDPEGDNLDVGFYDSSWADNLVGWWPMETQQDDSVYDWSGEGNDGTMYGGLNEDNYVAGHEGRALNFDGTDDYVNLSDDPFDLSAPVTLSAWIKPDENTANEFDVLGKYDGGGWIFRVRYDKAGNPPELWFGGGKHAGSDIGFTREEWQHFTTVWNGNTITYYRNGYAKDTISTASNISPNDVAAKIGQRGDDRYFAKGEISDLRIYNRALSETEIEQLYNSTYIDNDLASGSTASVQWDNLLEGQNYSFFAKSHDGLAFSDNSSIQTFSTPEWHDMEIWTGDITNSASWHDMESWAGSIETVAVSWNDAESWTGDILNTSAWNNIESWSGTVKNIEAWHDMESWTGTVLNVEGWHDSESWSGNILNTPSWHDSESWSGSIEEVIASWTDMESWSGDLTNTAQWNDMASWTGDVANVSEWNDVDTWSGTVNNIAVWQDETVWNGTIKETVASWRDKATWVGQLTNTAGWNDISSWTGDISNAASWTQKDAWTGSLEVVSEWNDMEFWTGSFTNTALWYDRDSFTGEIVNSSGWYDIESWTGSIFAPEEWHDIESITGSIKNTASWNDKMTWNGDIANSPSWYDRVSLSGEITNSASFKDMESWTGTIEVTEVWHDMESWSGSVNGEASWRDVGSWSGSIVTPVEWHDMDFWSGSIENVGQWHDMESWNGSILNTLEWHDMESWAGTVTESISAWNDAESWTGDISNIASWKDTESWSGTLETIPAGWNDVEVWSGDIRNVSLWQDVESWSGSIYNESSWNDMKTWSGTIETIGAIWNDMELWSGDISNQSTWTQRDVWSGSIISAVAWNDIDSWNGTIKIAEVWNDIDVWSGSLLTTGVWNDVESWGGALQAPAIWNDIESWTGNSVSTILWKDVDTWTGVLRTHPPSAVDYHDTSLSYVIIGGITTIIVGLIVYSKTERRSI